jgi:hypothetical protein
MVLGVALMKEKWGVEMIDIVAAFLEAELDGDIYIEWPQGVAEFGYFTEDEMDVERMCPCMIGSWDS